MGELFSHLSALRIGAAAFERRLADEIFVLLSGDGEADARFKRIGLVGELVTGED